MNVGIPMNRTARPNVNALCLAALELMREHRVAPLPHSYEVFYTYVAGSNADVTAALERLMSLGGGVDEDAVESIHFTYIAPEAATEALSQLGEKLNEQISATMGLTEEAANSSANFSGLIAKASEGVSAIKDPKRMAEAVSRIVAATQTMATKNAGMANDFQGLHSRIQALQSEVQSIRKDAVTDALTGIGNRRFLDRSVAVEMDRAKRSGSPLSLCFVDLDHFKAFNDTHGHQMGDAALRKVASVLVQATGAGDIVTRYGGEEFVVLLPGADIQAAREVVEGIRAALSSKRFVKKATGEELGVLTASFGLTQMRMTDDEDSFVKRADENVYRAKRTGRNRVEVDEVDIASIAAHTTRIAVGA